MARAPVVVGITGASGAIFGVRCLLALRRAGLETVAIITRAAQRILELEGPLPPGEVASLAGECFWEDELDAPVASGSFPARGMIVAPCSIKSLSAIAMSFNHNLLVRTADVMLKERRPLVLMVRESPLHLGHIELMARAARAGAVILPPVPAFYHAPASVEEVVDQAVGKALDILGIEHEIFRRWRGK